MKKRRGFPFLSLLSLILVALALWHWGKPPGERLPPHHPPPPPGYPDDPPAASRNLLESLHQALGRKDLLKLLDVPVESEMGDVGGARIRTYRETYRLPRRMDPESVSRSLLPSALSDGGAFREGRWFGEGRDRSYEALYGFSGGWNPVTLVFRPNAGARLALVIDDAGYAEGSTLVKLYALKVPATLAIIPGLEFSTDLARQVPSHGWEVICHMPMEGHEAVADGAYKWFVRRGTGSQELTKDLSEAIDDLPNCMGMNNHMGSRATEERDLMLQVAHFLKARGLFFLDSRTSDKTVARQVMEEVGVPTEDRNIFLDNTENPDDIRAQLMQAVARAKRKGFAVAIGHFREPTLRALAEDVPEAEAQGVKFVYLSELVK